MIERGVCNGPFVRIIALFVEVLWYTNIIVYIEFKKIRWSEAIGN